MDEFPLQQADFFARLDWRPDRMLLDDLVFRLEHNRNDQDWDLGQDCFVFYKIKPLVEQYQRFWSLQAAFRARNVFELGLWDGGSTAFWFEYLQPEKHVAIDITDRQDSPYFTQYKGRRNLEYRIKTYWGTDQSDKARLRELVQAEFDGPLDLVIDDASHMYALTKASFEALFPMLRPGGFYVIEDWAWSHWKEFHGREHPWAHETPLTKLICELVEATGSSTTLINNLFIYQGFTVVERGGMEHLSSGSFVLDEHISRRPERFDLRRYLGNMRRRHVGS